MEVQVATTEEPRDPFLPLRWESTGDQWWYATPIDWAAASGHYDVVRELLRLDDARLHDAATNRAAVARRLLLDCEPADKRHHLPHGGGGDGNANRLLRAGYGGWLLYTATAAGDERFVRELLAAQPLLVFDAVPALGAGHQVRRPRAHAEEGSKPRYTNLQILAMFRLQKISTR